MSNLIDLESVLNILGNDWTIENVVQKIQAGELPGFARIQCCSCDDEDDCDEYEIARITNIVQKEYSRSSDHTQWFKIVFEPIGSPPSSGQNDETGMKNNEIRLAIDEANYGHRVHGRLKSKSDNTIVSIEELCLLRSDVLTLATGTGIGKSAAQILAEVRHKTVDRHLYVDKIMKHIYSEMRKASTEYLVINHLRFIKEAEVPVTLVNLVTTIIKNRINEDYNAVYKPLSRAPKKSVTEPYFLPLSTNRKTPSE